jgi:acetoin utilization deacetylase AcuC-like enzyme
MVEIWEILTGFGPDAVLMACGADALIGDPLGGLSYTVTGVQKAAASPSALSPASSQSR